MTEKMMKERYETREGGYKFGTRKFTRFYGRGTSHNRLVTSEVQ